MTSGRSRRGRLAPRLCAVAGALLAAVSPGLSGTAAAASPAQPTSTAVVVQLRAGADADLLSRQATRGGGRVTHVFRAAVTGFSGTFTDTQIAALRRAPHVAVVEADAVVSATAATSVWGLDRIDQRRLLDCGPCADRAGKEVDPQVRGVETRGIEPLTPALQRRCSAN